MAWYSGPAGEPLPEVRIVMPGKEIELGDPDAERRRLRPSASFQEATRSSTVYVREHYDGVYPIDEFGEVSWPDAVVPRIPVMKFRERADYVIDFRKLWEFCTDANHVNYQPFQTQVQAFLEEQKANALDGSDFLDEKSAMGAVIARIATTFTVEDIPLRLADDIMKDIFVIGRMDDSEMAFTVKALVKKEGASVYGDFTGQPTAVHRAVCLSMPETIRVLLAIDCGPLETANMSGKVPLFCALESTRCEPALAVLDFMPNLKVRAELNSNGTIGHFHKMVHEPLYASTVRALLDRFVDQDVDKDGDTVYDVDYYLLDSPCPRANGNGSAFDSILQDPQLTEEYGNHRVVRLLLNHKWHVYGDTMMKFMILFTIISLIPITIVAITAPDEADPMVYASVVDYIRAACQALVACRAVGLVLMELLRWKNAKSNRDYLFKFDVYRVGDVLFVVAVVTFALLHVFGNDAQWVVLGLVYFFSAFQLLQLMAASQLLGVYMSVITSVLKSVPLKFSAVAAVVLYIFTGTFYPALRAHAITSDHGNGTIVMQSDHESILEFTSYFEVMFFALRDLIEGRSLVNYYSNAGRIGAFPVIWYLVFLIIAILVLRTMFLAEVVFKFAVVRRDALLAMEVNRRRLLPILESNTVLWKWVLPKTWGGDRRKSSQRFTVKELQAILEEDKGDGFLRTEKILAKQNDEDSKWRQRLVGLMVGQFQLVEKRVDQLSTELKDVQAEAKNGIVTLGQQLSQEANTLLGSVTSSRQHITDSVDESRAEWVRERDAHFKMVVEPTKDMSSTIAGLLQDVKRIDEQQGRVEKAIDVVCSMMESQKETAALQATCLRKQSDVLQKIMMTVGALEMSIQQINQDVKAMREANDK